MRIPAAFILPVIGMFVVSAAIAPRAPAQTGAPTPDCEIPTIVERFGIADAIGVKWNAPTSTLAFGRKDASHHFKIWLSQSDGRGAHMLRWSAWRSDRHQFPIAFHPTGKYLVVLVEQAEHPGNSSAATPGYGAYSDYWLIRTDGSAAWMLVQGRGDRDNAFTHGAFSPDGSTFVWTERMKYPKLSNRALWAGSYRFNVAHFQDGAMPKLTELRHIVPGEVAQGGEIESIASDNRTILFYSTLASGNLLRSRIYSMDLISGQITELSTDGFAQSPTFSANEQRIIYMTNAGSHLPGADWWIMDRDGRRKQRLTFFTQRGNPQSNGGRMLAGSLAVVDEHHFYGDVLTKLFGLTGYIVRVTIRHECLQ